MLRSIPSLLPYGGIPIHYDGALKDGQVLFVAGQRLFIGTRPWTYAEQFVFDCAVDIFGEDFLRQIGAWEPKHDEILRTLRRNSR